MSEEIVPTSRFVPDDRTKLFVPECEDSIKPLVGRIFGDVEEGERFYYSYAHACGFKSRKGTLVRSEDHDNTVLTRYVLCSREGRRAKNSAPIVQVNDPAKKKRMRLSGRVDCMARIVLQRVSGGRYIVKTFNEGHTHPMVHKDHSYLMTTNRKVDEVHQMVILSGIKANIGPMRSFRFFKELVGGYDKIGCTSIDFKNYARDLRAYVEGVDAHMLLENFRSKEQDCPGFKFFFDVCEENKLRRLIWADSIAIKNFSLFGDAVSFDATYRTNRYKMIFTPFTGKDNHGSCVSFGAALISNEDEESYSWVLQKFVQCMGAEPRVMTTDQDPALKKAIAAVLPNTSHRFCMWHIMMKVAEKLPPALRDDSDFKTKLDKIVWSDVDEIEEFEEKWMELMEEYDLTDHRWFSDMFVARPFWIPAFFRDTKMSGVFRTTSSSESENSFFKRFLNMNDDLVRLYMHYCSAMDAQRSSQDSHNMADENGIPDRVTELDIEKHAATIYTVKKFKDVQVEIVAAVADCIMSRMYSDGPSNIYYVDDIIDGIFKVCHNRDDDFLSCHCKLFIRKGMVCRHLIFIMRTIKLNIIPDKYIVKRWTKRSLQINDQVDTNGSLVRSESSDIGNNRYFVQLCRCIGAVNGKKEMGDRLYSELEKLADTFAELRTTDAGSNTKQAAFERFYGAKVPDKPDVQSPDQSNTKGSGAGRRRISVAEKVVIAALKPKRICRKCNHRGHHDSRNCPNKVVVE